MKAGTFVNVKIKLPLNGNGLYFPREALQGSISNAQVFVASEGKAVLRNITVNSGNDKYLQVISGLKEGDEVITAGMVNLSEGVAIKVVQND